ncbi:MAG: tRNA-dihydrouridine synthase A [Bacillariaceae sp.]|jgi:tRNA-dihydrouridine synthase A
MTNISSLLSEPEKSSPDDSIHQAPACDDEHEHLSQLTRLRNCHEQNIVDGDEKEQENDDVDDADAKELHVAPMLDYSKREFRKLFSILSTRLVVWTDMVVDETIAHTERLEDILERDRDLPNKQICQIGGNSEELCGKATQVVELIYGYDEINLNIDCPSDRVSQEREFGAILMKNIDKAYTVLESMQNNISSDRKTHVSIKCRVGVDDWDDLDFISNFIERLSPVCKRFYLHARKCVLNGLFSARQNRSVPPINYPRVYALCRKFPNVEFWINGGIKNLVQAKKICYGSLNPAHCHDYHFELPCSQCQLPHGSCMVPPYEVVPSNLRGCMLGRVAIDNPSIFWDADRYFYGMKCNPNKNRREVLEKYASYLENLYPRRCCDIDEEITYGIPVPKINQLRSYCPICRDTYETDEKTNNEEDKTANNVNINNNMIEIQQNNKIKITSRIVGRSLKPVRGLFHGVPKGKIFLHACDEAARDTSIRNCGPGYILRRVMQQIPSQIMDLPFILSEDTDVE